MPKFKVHWYVKIGGKSRLGWDIVEAEELSDKEAFRLLKDTAVGRVSRLLPNFEEFYFKNTDPDLQEDFDVVRVEKV
jgi:hypothetical protein